MATPEESLPGAVRRVENVGRSAARGVESVGYGASLVSDSIYWLLLGRRHGQTVRSRPIFAEMMEIGVRAIPIVTLLSATIGIMLAIQGIHQLSRFGAEEQVVVGVAFSMTREFAPLITGILVAGRSGSAFAARLAFGEMADGLLLSSQRVEPAKLVASGYEFRHANLEPALRHLLGKE